MCVCYIYIHIIIVIIMRTRRTLHRVHIIPRIKTPFAGSSQRILFFFSPPLQFRIRDDRAYVALLRPWGNLYALIARDAIEFLSFEASGSRGGLVRRARLQYNVICYAHVRGMVKNVVRRSPQVSNHVFVVLRS